MKLMRRTGAVALVALMTVALSGCSYNRFVGQEEAIKTQWAQVENQLQRRNDLIPNLVETVKGIAQQEKDVFGQIADSRAKLAGAKTPEQTIEAANQQSAALARLLVVVENYPQLRSSEEFARLHDSLEGTENRLATEAAVPVERDRRHLRLQGISAVQRAAIGRGRAARELRHAREIAMPIADSLLPEFDHEMTVTRKLLERVPEEQFDWKPHQKSMSLGQLAQHVATIPRWGDVTLSRTEFDLASEPTPAAMTTRGQLLDAFDHHVSNARAALVGKGDGELMTPWALKRGGTTIFSMPRTSVWRRFVMSHIIHHRAQLGVYLRMHDVPLPSVYGPSADEGNL